MDLLNNYGEKVEQATRGRDMRCANEDCQLFGVVLEADEIEVGDGEPCCAACQQILVIWNDDRTG